MSGDSLSVVMPVFNEKAHLGATIDALAEAGEGSGFETELVVVDDGSTDGSADVARACADGRLPVRVVSQPNRGRFEARRAGLEVAKGELVLLLDGRVTVEPSALRFVRERVGAGELVWTGHVHVESESAFGIFWRLLAELAWREYFDRPRTTSFGVREFDRYPKGTTCFLAPRALLLETIAGFRPHVADVRLANDDTPLLRDLAARSPIGISPEFSCIYAPRTNLGRFLRHAIRRGVVFVDGHGRRESRFFPVVLAFFPLSVAFGFAVARRPLVAPAAAAAATGLAAAVYGASAGRSREEVRALALVAPVYAFGHGLGMWRGLAEVVRWRLGRR
jgi:glycosyltransferase involved in cell wall biosynthesis